MLVCPLVRISSGPSSLGSCDWRIPSWVGLDFGRTFLHPLAPALLLLPPWRWFQQQGLDPLTWNKQFQRPAGPLSTGLYVHFDSCSSKYTKGKTMDDTALWWPAGTHPGLTPANLCWSGATLLLFVLSGVFPPTCHTQSGTSHMTTRVRFTETTSAFPFVFLLDFYF